jgi:hypothetical protein
MTRSILKPLAFALIFLTSLTQSGQACDVLCLPHLEWPDAGGIDHPVSTGEGNQTSSEEEG